MSEWFTFAVQMVQSVMLGVSGYWLLGSSRVMRRQAKTLERANDLIADMWTHIQYQAGIIAALQAGAMSTHNIVDVDFRNLPVELRIQIWMALLDVAVELNTQRRPSPKTGTPAS